MSCGIEAPDGQREVYRIQIIEITAAKKEPGQRDSADQDINVQPSSGEHRFT